MFSLIDCNNFFVSCERVFDPSLNGRPVLVLSNNDGCIISRSNEAKALGFGMGEPFFKVEGLAKKHEVAVFSSNFYLYGDLSNRVMQTLSQFTPKMEIYSIDEAFLDLSGMKSEQLRKKAQTIRQTVKQWTGIPVSIGIAPTKTLCKVANYFSKKIPAFQGICFLEKEEQVTKALHRMPIEELWGVGHNYAKLLKGQGIKTVLDFRNQSTAWIRSKMKVIGFRMQQELYGVSCLDIEHLPSPKKGILSSRSFGKPVYELEELQEAVAFYTTRAAEKLRAEGLMAKVITVYIKTNRHIENPFFNSSTIELPVSTCYTPELIESAFEILKSIYQKGYRYKKAGVYFSQLTPQSAFQPSLFDPHDRDKQVQLMQTIDRLNQRWGEGTLKVAAQGLQQKWKAKLDRRSPRYTTHWQELKQVQAS